MTFAASAIGGGMLATYTVEPAGMIESGVYAFGRNTMYRIANIYAIRMASVFMISLGTIWLRTRTMPRPLAIVTYAAALVLMISISYSLWVVLIFPAWVLIISIYILSATCAPDRSRTRPSGTCELRLRRASGKTVAQSAAMLTTVQPRRWATSTIGSASAKVAAVLT